MRVLCAIIALASAAYAQSAAPVPTPASTGLTDYWVFHFFFVHVSQIEARLAESLKHGSDTPEHHAWKIASGLTPDEEAYLRMRAQDEEDDVKAFDDASRKWRQQFPGPLPSSAMAEQQARGAQRQQIVQGYIDDLKKHMGAARFQALHDFAWSSEAPHIKPMTKLATPVPVTAPLPTPPK